MCLKSKIVFFFTKNKNGGPLGLRNDDRLNLRPFGNTEVLDKYSLTEV